MTIGERIQVIIKANNLTASSFADEIGFQRSAISHITTGRNNPGLEFIQAVLNRFPQVDAQWLITGTAKPKQEAVSPVIPGSEVKQADSAPSSGHKDQAFELGSDKKVDRMVVFFADGTFRSYLPQP